MKLAWVRYRLKVWPRLATHATPSHSVPVTQPAYYVAFFFNIMWRKRNAKTLDYRAKMLKRHLQPTFEALTSAIYHISNSTNVETHSPSYSSVIGNLSLALGTLLVVTKAGATLWWFADMNGHPTRCLDRWWWWISTKNGLTIWPAE